MTQSCRLLNDFFKRKQNSRPGFSVRNFARELQVSATFASALLAGKKLIPPGRLEQLAIVLNLDDLALKSLKQAIIEETLEGNGLHAEDCANRAAPAPVYELIPKNQFSILNPWYNIAILDLTACDGFRNNPTWIAGRLGISSYQATLAIQELTRRGFLEETESGLKKVTSKIRLALNQPHHDVRKFHSSMITKAKILLETEKNWDKREITGVTISGNSKNFAKARVRLGEALHEVAEILSEGEADELYQINGQLFSLLQESAIIEK